STRFSSTYGCSKSPNENFWYNKRATAMSTCCVATFPDFTASNKLFPKPEPLRSTSSPASMLCFAASTASTAVAWLPFRPEILNKSETTKPLKPHCFRNTSSKSQGLEEQG